MPWEVTISRADSAQLGDLATVRQQILAAFPAIQFHREPSGPEKIEAARAAGVEFPDIIRQHLEQRPATVQAEFEGDGFSIRLYGFEAHPLTAICAEVRGDGNPGPVLAALCRPYEWVAVDDASGQPMDDIPILRVHRSVRGSHLGCVVRHQTRGRYDFLIFPV